MPVISPDLAEFQKANCRTCKWADKKQIGKGPCCTNMSGPQVVGEFCYRYVSASDDPEYRCRDCGRLVRVKSVDISRYSTRRCPQCHTKHVLTYDGGGLS